MLKYAGVNLVVPTPEIAAWIEAHITLAECVEFERAGWPGERLAHGPFPGLLPDQPVTLGTLRWPWGADRFACGHFLATDTQLATIRQTVYAAGNLSPATLLLEWRDDAGALVASIAPSLWMLPPRPLAQIASLPTPYEQCYLLTLVDDRFWWRFRDASLSGLVEPTATWSQVFAALSAAIGAAFSGTGVARPPEAFLRRHGRATLLLDQAARNCGLRFVRALDGTCALHTVSDTLAARNAGVALATAQAPKAGGRFLLDNTQPPHDLPPAIPETVRVTFPTSCVGCCCDGDEPRTSVDVDPFSLGIFEIAGVGHNGSVKTFHDTLLYCTATVAEAESLADSIATDYVRWQLAGSLDRAYWGVVPWPLEGAHDVLWTYLPWDVSTRVTRGLWGEINDVLEHAGTVYTGAKCEEWVRLQSPLTKDDPCGESYPAYLRRRADNCTWDEDFLEIYALPVYPQQSPIFGRSYLATCRGLHADGKWIYSLRGEDQFPGKILSGSGPSYTVLERRYLGSGQFEDLPASAQPRTITAWEANGAQNLAAGTHVLVWVFPEDESYPNFGYVFWKDCDLKVTGTEGICGGTAVEIVPTCHIEFDGSTHLIVEEMGDEGARVKWQGVAGYDEGELLCCFRSIEFVDTACIRFDISCSGAGGLFEVEATTTGSEGSLYLYRYECVGGRLREYRRTAYFYCGQFFGASSEVFVGYQGCCECPPYGYWWCWCPYDATGYSGSGAYSGSGSGVQTDCCLDPLPATLYLSVPGEGTVTLAFVGCDADGCCWVGSKVMLCGELVYFRVCCDGGLWQLGISCDNTTYLLCTSIEDPTVECGPPFTVFFPAICSPPLGCGAGCGPYGPFTLSD